MSPIKFLWCSLLLAIKVSAGNAQQFDEKTAVLNSGFKTYTINDGLPAKNTTSTIQDKRGFIWVGTENGLCRFDGYSFKTFVNIPGDSSSITNNYINALMQDRSGKIWIATMDGLNLFDPLSETVTRFYHSDKNQLSLSNNKIWSLFCDSQGRIWIGTDDGFNEYLPKQKKFETYRPNGNSNTAMVGKSVNSIVEDRFGNLWLGNWSGGLNKFDRQSRHFQNFQQEHSANRKNPNDVWALEYGTDGNIWVGTYWSGLFKFDPQKQVFTKVVVPDGENTAVFSIMQVNSETLLIGGNSGFFWYNLKNQNWEKLNGIQNYAFGDSYQDKNGIVWINSRNGLQKIDRKQYKFQLSAVDLAGREVKSVVADDQSVWIATNKGLFKIDQKTGKQIKFTKTSDQKSLTSNDINKLYFDGKGNLWILTENGFDCYDAQNNSFSHHYHHSSIGNLFNEDVFRDILEVDPGIYMLATDAGLKIYDSKTNRFAHYYNQSNNPTSINNNHAYSLAKAPDGKIWIGTYGGGINIFDRRTHQFQSMQATDRGLGLSSNIIRDIFIDSKQRIWVCTPDGLNYFNPKTNRFEVLTRKNGFSSNVFNEITEDSSGNLWVRTETGVSVYHPSNKQVRNFDEADGLFVNAAIYKFQNQIFLAGSKGYISFDPKSIKFNPLAPPVYLTDFQLFNKSITAGKNSPLAENLNTATEIRLRYDESVFSIEFVGLNYTYSWKNEYAYKLVGFDKKWNYVGRQRKATYTNLNPGTYEFWVKASNNDGLWNSEGRKIIIIIRPPWYLTWWAYLVYTVFTVGAIYIFLVYRDKQKALQYKVQIANLESEKEKELNEKKLSFFTNISHEFRTPLTLIINPVKELLYENDKNIDTSSLHIVYRNAKRLLSLVDQLLLFRKADVQADTLKAGSLNVVGLCKEVFLCFSHQARTKNIEYDFIAPDESLDIYADREKLEISIFNLLSNAFKFTPDGGKITFEISERAYQVEINITDNGCGIPDDAREKIFNRFYQGTDLSKVSGGGFGIGLYLVKNFIEMHGGSIECKPALSGGSTFQIKLLKGVEHIKFGQIIQDPERSSVFLEELFDEQPIPKKHDAKKNKPLETLLNSEKKTILIIDDNQEISDYLTEVFLDKYEIFSAADGEEGLVIIRELLPDVVISDVMMQRMGGIELCSLVKDDPTLCHIPIVLLTASTSAEIKLKGIESGADDYISKPFDKELLVARIASILKSKNSLQKYFYGEITLNPTNAKISAEYKDFLLGCIRIVEENIEDPNFNIKILADQIGMSRSNLFNKIKSISGHSSNSFIRFIRLRKAAEIFINTDNTILQTMYMVGINDIKYFREQFYKVFEMNPSDYIKRYRKTYLQKHSLDPEMKKTKV